MLDKLLKLFVLVALMVLIPVAWWSMAPWKHGFMSKSLFVSTGGSLFLLGLCYKLIGTWDLIPDWLPLLGNLDDSVAWIMMAIGAGLGGVGFFVLT